MNQNTVKLQNFEKQNHINISILNRQITENNLQPNIDFRPIPTKYTHFNVFGNLQEKTDTKYRDYDITTMYNSGNRKSHFSGFSNNIDNESVLQNRVYALQRDERSVYVPNTTSQLYNEYKPNTININTDIDNYRVFSNHEFNSHNPNYSDKIGSDYFNNSTRVQLKSIQ